MAVGHPRLLRELLSQTHVQEQDGPWLAPIQMC